MKLRENETWVQEYLRFPFRRNVPVLGKAEEMLFVALGRWPIRTSITSMAVICGSILLADNSTNDVVWFIMKYLVKVVMLFVTFLAVRHLFRAVAGLGYAAAFREMRREGKLGKEGAG